MAKKGEAVVHVTLACPECGRRTYHTKKNKATSQGKLLLNKYCKWDRKHTVHKEV
jgi:large subunit ribosomal protein L33